MTNNIFGEANRQGLTWTTNRNVVVYGGRRTLRAGSAQSRYYQDPAGKHIVSSAPFLHRPRAKPSSSRPA